TQHGDTFSLSPSAIILAYTSNNYTAAYRINKAFCIQFHLEKSVEEFNESVHRALSSQI
ncbi:unnamed protein product, partial [Didymodactylos carnosus]